MVILVNNEILDIHKSVFCSFGIYIFLSATYNDIDTTM